MGSYLNSVHLIHDRDNRLKLQARLLTILSDGVLDNEETRTVIGLRDPDFAQYPIHEETLIRHVCGWLTQHRFVLTGCEAGAPAKIVDLDNPSPDALARLKYMQPVPSCITLTSGGYHAYWWLDKPLVNMGLA